jgi:hypothetical protein
MGLYWIGFQIISLGVTPNSLRHFTPGMTESN